MATMTRTAFLKAYKEKLVEMYPWCQEPKRLASYMAGVEATIIGKETSWNQSGAACTAAWQAIGGKGKPSMKNLRNLQV